MSKLVVKIQLLTMKMINLDLAVFIFFTSSPFVLTSTLVVERLEKSSETRLYVFQKKWNLKMIGCKTCIVLTDLDRNNSFSLMNIV